MKPRTWSLVEDQILNRRLEGMISFPIEIVECEPGTVLVDVVPVRLGSPDITAADDTGIWVREDLGVIET